jgi:hypothetical protein
MPTKSDFHVSKGKENMNEKFWSEVFVITVILLLSLYLFVPMPFTQRLNKDIFTYDIVGTTPNQTVTIAGYISIGNNVVIPATIDGYPVTSIGNQAFQNCSSLTNITIPDTVKNIGNQAFSGCSSLSTATFLGNAPTGTTDMFAYCASGFTVHYKSGTTGWTNPWYGYQTTIFVPDSSKK